MDWYANFYLTHPFLDLVSGRSANWQTVHVRVGGVQPLNLEAKLGDGFIWSIQLEQSLWKQSGTCQIQ